MFAKHPHEWSSVTTKVQDYGWNKLDRQHNIICLKDTRKGKYKNELINSTTFRYELPGNSVIDTLLRDPDGRERYTVHLFGVQNARDHYLGEWMAVDYRERRPGRNVPHVELHRLAHQDVNVTMAYTVAASRKRSRNEGVHEDILSNAFPDYIVLYEPDCQTNIGTVMVDRGVHRQWAGDSYTVDFVLASRTGCERIAVESKYDTDAVDEVALQKCRALRDRSGQRVVIMAGNATCRYLDMGPPMAQAEVWYDTIPELRQGLRLS